MVSAGLASHPDTLAEVIASPRLPVRSNTVCCRLRSVISLLWVESVLGTGVALFGLGLGWNLSFVAATAELADRTEPRERGKLLGFNDLLSGLTGAGLALLGGVALSALGVAALAIGGTALVLGPALWILREHGPRALAPRQS